MTKPSKKTIAEATALMLGAPLSELRKFAAKHGHTAPQILRMAEGRAPEETPASTLLSLDPQRIALARHSISRGEMPDLAMSESRVGEAEFRKPSQMPTA